MQVFLCHSSQDKKAVRALYRRLKDDGFDPWLDEENILGGVRWEPEIEKAVRQSDVVLVCLSREAASKRGFVQKEIKFALDVADEQPEGTIYLIPTKLEECEVPERLKGWQWVDLFAANGYDKLRRSLRNDDYKVVIAPPPVQPVRGRATRDLNSTSEDRREFLEPTERKQNSQELRELLLLFSEIFNKDELSVLSRWLKVTFIGEVVGLFVGLLVGGAVLGAFQYIIHTSGGSINDMMSSPVWFLPLFAGYFAFGIVLGATQKTVLKRHIKQVGWWMVATSIGTAVFGVVIGAAIQDPSNDYFSPKTWLVNVGGDVSFTVFGAAFGFILGTAQRTILKRHVEHAGWWTIANLTGGCMFGEMFRAALDVSEGVGGAIGTEMFAVAGGAVGGAVFAAITGIGLIVLLRYPRTT